MYIYSYYIFLSFFKIYKQFIVINVFLYILLLIKIFLYYKILLKKINIKLLINRIKMVKKK